MVLEENIFKKKLLSAPNAKAIFERGESYKESVKFITVERSTETKYKFKHAKGNRKEI